MAKELAMDLSAEEIKGMIYEADRDRDGEVSVEEFLRLMRKAKIMWGID